MKNLKIHGKLLLGLLSTLAAAAPLSCGDDASNGVSAGGDAGASGSSETAGNGGRSTQGGSSTQGGGAGVSAGGLGAAGTPAEGGADMGGASPAGGEAGMTVNGLAGEGGMAGAAPVDEAAQYQMQLDSICTVQGALNCSQTAMPASDKQACLDSFAGLPEFAPNCDPQIKAWVTCLVPQPGSSYNCADGSAFPNDDVCADTSAAMNTCFSQ